MDEAETVGPPGPTIHDQNNIASLSIASCVYADMLSSATCTASVGSLVVPSGGSLGTHRCGSLVGLGKVPRFPGRFCTGVVSTRYP